ncbi:colicin V synthesis protein, partial [Klebsiella pneumoniae]|uniref:cysteine peptidase family C39 domain-containing protein n=1 Tax=Klebsiella pneumoniae TaxID=573 RepID=UPI0010286B27
MTNELFKTVVAKLNFSLVNKTPVILQSESSECGIACLAMVCGFYGLNIDLFNFRQRFGSPSQGSSLMSLSKTAEHAGLKSRALALDLDEIKQLKLPCIIHWGMNHYVVLTKVRKNAFVIHDPALGKRIIGINEMSNNFTGVALELWPDHNFQQEEAKSRLRLLDLMHKIVGLKSALIKIFAYSVVVEAIGLLLPIGTQLVTDHVIMAHDQSLLSVICIGLIFFTLFRTFISMLRQWKTTLFDHLTILPLSFFATRLSGDIQSLFSSLYTIRSIFTSSIVTGIIDSLMTIDLLVLLTLYGVWFVWVVIGYTICKSIMRFAIDSFYRR